MIFYQFVIVNFGNIYHNFLLILSLQVYVKYCSNQVYQDRTLKKLRYRSVESNKVLCVLVFYHIFSSNIFKYLFILDC